MSEQVTLDPLEGILAVLDRGSSTGTNKFGLLLAILDLAPYVGVDRTISIDALAAKLIEIHWDHVEPFGKLALRQVTSKNRDLTVLNVVSELRGSLPQGISRRSFVRARPHVLDVSWSAALARVARDTERNPLALLQTIDGKPLSFLFSISGKTILLNPGVPAVLTRFGPVLRELVESRFVQQVIVANPALRRKAVDQQLRMHLFGSDREMPGEDIRVELREIQRGVCLYTQRPLHQSAPVDHVLPWARVRISALGNFLLTDGATNSRKKDLLLAYKPVDRWLNYMEMQRGALHSIAVAHGWPFEMEHVVRSARALYGALQPGAVLWSAEGTHSATKNELEKICDLLDAV